MMSFRPTRLAVSTRVRDFRLGRDGSRPKPLFVRSPCSAMVEGWCSTLYSSFMTSLAALTGLRREQRAPVRRARSNVQVRCNVSAGTCPVDFVEFRFVSFDSVEAGSDSSGTFALRGDFPFGEIASGRKRVVHVETEDELPPVNRPPAYASRCSCSSRSAWSSHDRGHACGLQ